MRIIALSLLIVCAIITVPSFAHVSAVTSPVGLSYDYNFTGLPINSFPGNNSLITFERFTSGSFSNVSVQNGHGKRGLQIYGLPSNGSGYTGIKINISHSANFSLKMTFSWNADANLMDTGEVIAIGNNSTNGSLLRFGPLYNRTAVVGGGKNRVVWNEPRYSEVYTLEISHTNTNPGRIFLSISDGWNSSSLMQFPLAYNSIFRHNTISLIVMGVYSNITLYNLYVGSPSKSIYPILISANQIAYKSRRIDLNYSGRSESLADSNPVIDQNLSDIIFVNVQNDTISSLNYQNTTTSSIANIGNYSTRSLEYSESCNAYYLFHNGNSLEVMDVNLENLSTKVTKFVIENENYTRFFVLNDLYILMTNNGTVIIAQNIHNSVTELHSITLGSDIIYAGVYHQNFTALWSDKFLNNISRLTVLSDGNWTETEFGEISSVANIETTNTSAFGTIFLKFVSFKNESLFRYFFSYSDSPASELINFNYTMFWDYGNSILLDRNGTLYIQRNQTMDPTNVAILRGSSLYLSSNLDYGLMTQGNNFTILYQGTLFNKSNSTPLRITNNDIRMHWLMFMGFAYFKVSIDNLSSANASVRWQIDGNVVSRTQSFNYFLLPGYHTISVTIRYKNQTVSTSSRIFVFGFLPELAVAIVLVAIISRNRFYLNHDSEVIKNLISSNAGKSRNEITHVAKKSKMSVPAVRRTIKEMARSGEVSIKEDLDGKLYVMMKK